jgi:hypothetical protein
MNLRIPIALGVAVLLGACATTSIKHTWKSPEYQGGPLSKFAVLAIDDRGLVRQGFENRFVSQLKKYGAKAVTTFDQLTLNEINTDKKAAATRLMAADTEAVITLRFVDSATYYRETRPGHNVYVPITTGFDSYAWGSYYSVAFADMGTTFGNLTVKVYLDAGIFDLKTGQRLWTGITETVVKETTDRVAEMDPLVAKILAEMRKDGMIP